MELRFKSVPLQHSHKNENASEKPESESAFASACRKNVNEYFKEKGISPKGNTALVIKSVAMFSFYIIPFLLILTVSMPWWVALILSAVIGVGIAGLGMGVMHDACHGASSNKEWLNNLLGGTMNLLGGSVRTWKMQHNVLHHTYTNIAGGDGDIAPRWPLRLSENAPIKKVHHYQYIHAFFFYGLMTITRIVNDFKQLSEFSKSNMTNKFKVNLTKEYFIMAAVKVIYLFVFIGLPIIFTHFSWWQVIIGFVTMHWVAGFILSTIFQLAHVVEEVEQPLPDEKGIIYHDWAVHELRTTADFARNNRFINWYVGGLNFQIEHHLFPYISHVHYPKIAPIVERTANEFGLPYNSMPSFGSALASHIRKLKELGLQNPIKAV